LSSGPENHEGSSGSAEPTSHRPQKKQRSFLRELPVLIGVALVLSIVLQAFVFRVFLIPSESMEPTLHGCAGCTGDRIVVEKIGYRFGDPEPGDVVVFKGPDSWNTKYVSNRSDNVVIRGIQEVGSWVGLVPPDENDLVKRVIATGGQTVECCDDQGRVLVDGKPLNEPYIKMDFPFTPGTQTCDTEVKSGRCFGPITVPEGHVWVMATTAAIPPTRATTWMTSSREQSRSTTSSVKLVSSFFPRREWAASMRLIFRAIELSYRTHGFA